MPVSCDYADLSHMYVPSQRRFHVHVGVRCSCVEWSDTRWRGGHLLCACVGQSGEISEIDYVRIKIVCPCFHGQLSHFR